MDVGFRRPRGGHSRGFRRHHDSYRRYPSSLRSTITEGLWTRAFFSFKNTRSPSESPGSKSDEGKAKGPVPPPPSPDSGKQVKRKNSGGRTPLRSRLPAIYPAFQSRHHFPWWRGTIPNDLPSTPPIATPSMRFEELVGFRVDRPLRHLPT